MDDKIDYTVQFGIDNNLLKQRAMHDTLAPVQVRSGINGKVVETCLRVATDTQLFIMLEREGLEYQYRKVKLGMTTIAQGLMPRARNYAESGSGFGSRDLNLVEWVQWTDDVKRKGLSMDMVEDVVLMGLSLRKIDRKHGRSDGTAKKNLIAALRLW